MNLDVELAHFDLAIAHLNQRRRRDQQITPTRRFWVKPWLLERDVYGQYTFLMMELQLKDVVAFRNYVRMSPDFFWALLDRLGPRIAKQNTNWREAISPGCRLALTLRFLATGDSYMSLRYNFRVAHNTISKIVRQVTEAIIEEFAEEQICPPVTPDKWKLIADKFGSRWNFPHAIGALDGKHVAIKCPQKSGSLYFNYKRFYSIVMLALVDADYKFIWLDVGCNGAASDAQIWNSCELLEVIQNNTVGIPQQSHYQGEM